MDLPNLDARLTGAQAALRVGVSRQLINYWRASKKLQRGPDGRYRYGDVLRVEAATRNNALSSRSRAA